MRAGRRLGRQGAYIAKLFDYFGEDPFLLNDDDDDDGWWNKIVLTTLPKDIRILPPHYTHSINHNQPP